MQFDGCGNHCGNIYLTFLPSTRFIYNYNFRPKQVSCEHIMEKICKILGIERKLSTVYHTERMNQTVETFLRIYIDFDQRNWVKLLFITDFVINNKDAVSTGINFFLHGYHAKILKTDEKLHEVGNEIGNFIQKADGIFTKLKQANDWVQTVMVAAQQKQQKYVDRFKIQTTIYKIKFKIQLTLKNITAAIKNKEIRRKTG